LRQTRILERNKAQNYNTLKFPEDIPEDKESMKPRKEDTANENHAFSKITE